jgi:Uma2 family endonuclease
MVMTIPVSTSMIAHARGTHIGRNRRMHKAVRTRRWTRADLDRMPDDGNRYEVIDGALLVSPPPSPDHERLHIHIARRLASYLEQHRQGEVFNGHHAVILGESQVEPDLVVVPLTSPRATTWADMPKPILVVEVLSPTSVRRDQVTKRDLYRRQAIPEYWIVDGDARTVRVVTAQGERVESATLRWRPEIEVPYLDIDLQQLFRSALGPR